MPEEFSDKTNQLLEYIEKTYLKGIVGANVGDGKNILEKMKLAENSNKVGTAKKVFNIDQHLFQAKAMDYGFDNIFAEGPTPTPGAMEPPLEHLGELTDSQYLNLAQDEVDGVSLSNVDGMNVQRIIKTNQTKLVDSLAHLT